MPTLHFLYYCLVGDKTNIINNSISTKQLFQSNRNDKWCDHISLDFKHSIYQAETYHTNAPNPVQEIQTTANNYKRLFIWNKKKDVRCSITQRKKHSCAVSITWEIFNNKIEISLQPLIRCDNNELREFWVLILVTMEIKPVQQDCAVDSAISEWIAKIGTKQISLVIAYHSNCACTQVFHR